MTQNTSTILVLDDETLALDYLVETIEDVQQSKAMLQNFKILSTTKQTDFWELLKTNLPKIVFLDIQMPGKSGIDIANEIRENAKSYGYKEGLPLIVFCTAFEDYGYSAFKVEAVDYILKPIDTDVLVKVFEKIQQNYSHIIHEVIEIIKVPTNGLEVDLSLKKVLYFKADMKYINVYTYEKEFLINTTLLQLEEKFPNFIKIHRAYLVNPAYIAKFFRKDNHWFLALKNHNEYLPVSRRQKQEIEGRLTYNDLFNGTNED